MNLFALADDTWLAIIKDVIAFLGMVFTGVMAFYMAKLNNKANAASATIQDAATSVKQATLKAGEVQAALKQSTTIVANQLENLVTATEQTNTLVNVGNEIADKK